jgi:hypothetical protein
MGLFSSSSEKKPAGAAQAPIPEEILSQVTVMGDAPKRAFPEAAPDSAARPESPFLSAAPAPATKPKAPGAPANLPTGETPFAPAKPQVSGSLPPEQSIASASFPTKKKRSFPFLWGGSILLLLLIAAGVGYVVYSSRQSEAPLPDPAPLPAVEQSSTPAVPEAPFALDKPNSISLNTETSTPESIEAALRERGEEILRANITQPVEFVIADQNSNPIALSRFAFLSGLALDPTLLSTFDEPFTIYLYNDAGSIRRALVAYVK